MRPIRRIAVSAAAAVVAATSLSLVSTTSQAATSSASTFGSGTPTFVNSAAPAGLPNADNAGEPSIGTNWNSGAALYQAYTSTYKLTFDNSTATPGVTWADVSSPYSQFNLDPILATDSSSGTTLAGGDDGPCAVMSKTTDDGATWTPSVPCPFTADHPTVGFGPVAPGNPLAAVTTGPVAYFCQQTVLDECSRSLDAGTTWSPSIVPQAGCTSLHGHVKASPDGTAYVPSANCTDASGNNVVGAFRSSDNGTTWDSYGIPGAPIPTDSTGTWRGFDPSIATTPDNTVYESWSRTGDFHPVVTWSHDHGATWAPQVDLATTVSPALSAATFEAAVGGDNGRAAVAYLGTWAPKLDKPNLTPFDAGYHGVWYLFVSYTYDGGQTWTTVQATPEPVQRGYIYDGGTTTNGQRNLLDFMDASVTKDGRVVVAYADGCTGTCNGAGAGGTDAQSTSAHATAAYQSGGQGLFAAYDAAAPLATPTTTTSSAGTSKVKSRPAHG